MMTDEELHTLRRKWVAGSFPTTGEAQAMAALVIESLIEECFALREVLAGRQLKITTKGARKMTGVVRFYRELRPGKLGCSQQLSLVAFNRLYEPDLYRLFNPPRGEMPFTYYRNLRSGNKFMVAALLPGSR